MLPDYIVENWKGLRSKTEESSIPKGYCSNVLNWFSFGDHIELRRGSETLGVEDVSGLKVSGLKVGRRTDGMEQIFKICGKKIYYYTATTNIWTEIGNDIIPAAAAAEDIAMEEFQSLSGTFIYVSSPNLGVLKLATANPDSYKDQQITDFKGKIRIKSSKTFLWDRKDSNGGKDETGLYRSTIDRDELSDYAEVAAEVVGTGDANTKIFSGTLIGLTGVKTCLYVRITDGVETFVDNRSGVLEGNKGGMGTINYITGAFSVTFKTAPTLAQSITANYYTEDSTAKGILDFSYTSPIRLVGEGLTFRQDDGGGAFQNIGTIGSSEYCFHEYKTYKLTIASTDDDAANIPWRNNVGIQNWRAMEESSDGLYYIDSRQQSDPSIRILKEGEINPNVLPSSISEELNLSGFDFSESVVKEYNPFLVVACKAPGSLVNNRLIFWHKFWDVWTITDYRVSVMDTFVGSLIAGDSASGNVYKLLSGISDDESNIENFWDTGEDKMDKEGMERFHRFIVKGNIDAGQSFDILFSYDRGKFVKVGTIDGAGSYVDKGINVSVGNYTIGEKPIGGKTLTSHPYERTMKIHTPKFETLKIRFVATKIGYCSVSEYQCQDRRYKGRRTPAQYIG